MSHYLGQEKDKITVQTIRAMKTNGEPIAMLTAYDYTMAHLIDQSQVDMILVGDSAANVMAGHSTTLPITLDQMIYHAASVVRGVSHAMVIVDMPFGSYQVSPSQALSSAIRIMKESGADAVKMEGGAEIIEHIRVIVNAGIPVMGHLGLTPQSIHRFGGYGVRARSEEEAARLIADAHSLEEVGCFALVLEKIPASLATSVSNELKIPVIGIGAGAGVDGQVLVGQDMLGLTENFKPKFLRQYAELGATVRHAVAQYISDVKSGEFPNEDEMY